MENELKLRKEVPLELTWDLTAIYPDEQAMLQDLTAMKALCAEIEDSFKGKLNTPQNIAECMNCYLKVLEKEALLSNYAELAYSVDYTDTHLMELNGTVSRELTECRSMLTFIESEIAQNENEVILEAAGLAPECKNQLCDLIRQKPHRLAPETEKVLSAYAQTMSLPYEIYNAAKLADMDFPPFSAEGKQYPLGYSLFEDNYEYESNTPVRRAAFEAFSNKIREYVNTTAAAYNAQVQQEKVTATLRGFSSVIDYLLFDQKVTREMYDRQIDLIMEKLAPHMRRYAKLIARLYHLDRMTYADLKLPLDSGFDPKVSVEESHKYIENGLSILGEDYVEMTREAYRERWVDFAKNKGKSTGGFCSSPYGTHSYILLSWNDRMSDVFTLAHELGHAGHFKLCNAAQSIADTNVSTYFVEAPSTINELIMGHYLLKTSNDKRFRRWVLSCMVSNTYYHNFVTHLLEAAYQREVYRAADQGITLQAETLSGIMKDVLQKFWGDAVELTPGAELTWMRQPHYYMGLYSYTYSAGLTIGTQVCKRIEKEGVRAVKDWKKVLSAGSTASPLELAQMAGVDISASAPLLDTIETIGEMIEEMISLTDELENAK